MRFHSWLSSPRAAQAGRVAAAPLAGVIIDSPIAGLGYQAAPSGLSGLTSATGQFTYNPGDTLAVGAYLEDSTATWVNGDQANNSASNSGAVYIYRAQ